MLSFVLRLAIHWLVLSSYLLEPTDQGTAGLDTPRRLEDPRAVYKTASVSCEPAGVYPIFNSLLGARRSLCVAPLLEGGGDEETRTPDPLLAKEMLFQLSYVPLPARLNER
jgi:hypothetical protein